jgi:hypothetical protein
MIGERREPAATSTDLWKLAGLVFVLVDHYGLFFAEDEGSWRVVGRLAAPIFFFFIGFARTRSVPWSWVTLGAILTITDVLTSQDLEDVSLNVLLNFALLRWVLLPLLDAHVLQQPSRLAAFIALCTVLSSLSQRLLEYGTEGWLWALVGLARRSAQDRQASSVRVTLIASATAVVYVWREILDNEFTELRH